MSSLNADSSLARTSYSLSFQPLFMIINAGKFDFEWQPAGKKLGYVFTAELYSGRAEDFNDASFYRPSDKISGVGIGASQKIKFYNRRSSPYLAYGLTYRYQEISVEAEGFYEVESDNLNYYEYGPVERKHALSNGLASLVVGYQKAKHDFLWDYYFGFGYKKQFNNTEFGGHREYNKYPYSFAYKGAMMVMGLKLGFRFE